MPDPSTLALFLVATLAVNLSPGPSMLYVSSRAAAEGRRAGLLSALGLGVGGFCHAIAAALGLSALLLQSAVAYSTVKYLGAAYLVYLGASAIVRSAAADVGKDGSSPGRTSGHAFAQGVLTDVLNPKIALFFLAFLPQFVSAGADHPIVETLLLGAIFCVSGTLVNGALALIVSASSSGLPPGAAAGRWLRRLCGAALIGLGLRLALATER